MDDRPRTEKWIGRFVQEVLLMKQGGIEPTPNELKWFISVSVPDISIDDYIQRWTHYNTVGSNAHLILAAWYLYRVFCDHPDWFTRQTMHRWLLAAFMIATKYHDDGGATNETYARIGGVTVKELNHMETDFLTFLQWDAFVPLDTYVGFDQALMTHYTTGTFSIF